jgi:hypothetical protein
MEVRAHVGYTLHLLALRVPLVALDTLAGGTSSGARVSLSTTLSVQLNATAAATFVGFDISTKKDQVNRLRLRGGSRSGSPKAGSGGLGNSG